MQHSLELSTEWVHEAPISILDQAILAEISLTCWELFVTSLHIPQAQAEFEFLCADPPALQEAAGLLPVPPTLGVVATDRVSRRPHPCLDKRRVRR